MKSPKSLCQRIFQYLTLACCVGISGQIAPVAAEEAAHTGEIAPGVVLTVNELRVTKHNVLLARFTLENKSQQLFSTSSGTLIGKIGLYDVPGRKIYRVMAAGLDAVGSHESKVKPGSTTSIWGHFSLPPAGLKSVSVQYADELPIEDVPIVWP